MLKVNMLKEFRLLWWFNYFIQFNDTRLGEIKIYKNSSDKKYLETSKYPSNIHKHIIKVEPFNSTTVPQSTGIKMLCLIQLNNNTISYKILNEICNHNFDTSFKKYDFVKN